MCGAVTKDGSLTHMYIDQLKKILSLKMLNPGYVMSIYVSYSYLNMNLYDHSMWPI